MADDADGADTYVPVSVLPQHTADDRERARELYKYFQPPKAQEPIDTVLTAHAQLVAWRLSAGRAMVSLIDEETQYFVAESTKTIHLDDAAMYDDPDDALWAGCVRVPKAGRLCEHTLATLPPPEGGPACFEVLDLSKDVRFNRLSFIAGPPHFRYYAGVPLRTSRGINIGSIYILDSKVRPALTSSERSFLGVMADNIIQHLEMTRDKKDRQRTFKMNECLQAYVDPLSEHAKHRRRYSNHSESTGSDSDDSKRTADGTERIAVISRAAELLREAMDLEDGGGGVLFLDTALAALPSQQPSTANARSGVLSTANDTEKKEPRGFCQQTSEFVSAPTSIPGTRSSSPETRRNRNVSTEILAHTYRSVGTSLDQPEFTSFTPEELLKLIKRYPRGKMFTFDQQGEELSDSSENGSLVSGRPRSLRRRQRSTADSATLHAHFPKARQIIFIPGWDSTTSRASACFVYNRSEYRNFSRQLEFLHCITFNNCVDTELTRLANLKEHEQKSDFIGSISHELRSPLHGILASCEFLQDTSCTSFQQSLVNTAEGCARTLLDTVNMVLDYSKINAFEKSKGNSGLPALADHQDTLQTSLSTHRNINLAVLTEEVVEGVATGHAFSISQNRAIRSNPCDENAEEQRDPEEDTASTLCKPDVELVVGITKYDWIYWCEPGSFRRIVMNLVGNSLKYTKSGFVQVQLAARAFEQTGTEEMVLTVTDSGQGISPEYLKNKLFTPFAQESNQAPGVGLGLSLVKSIVNTLGGHIDVDSTMGVGTKVTVRIPLARQPTHTTDTKSDSALNEKISTVDNDGDIRRLRNHAMGRSIAIFDFESQEKKDEASQLMHKSLTAYLDAWYGFSVIPWRKDALADIVVVDEADLAHLYRDAPQLSEPHCLVKVLVLRSTGSAQGVRAAFSGSNIEDVRHPFGPHKLARALQACLDRARPRIASPPTHNVKVSETSIDSIAGAAGNLSLSDVKLAPFDRAPTIELDCVQPADVQRTVDVQVNLQVDVKLGASDPQAPLPTNIPSAPPAKSIEHLFGTASKIAPQPTSTPSDPAPKACRVLLVDDNTINLRLLQVGMKKRGYTSVSSASDGLQAVNTYRALLDSSTPPHIILMDLSMPIMNGFEATRQIRAIEGDYNGKSGPGHAPHHSLIVALTGLASVRDQKEAYTAGVDSYIMKPMSFAKLTKLLEDWTADGKIAPAAGVPEAAVSVTS